MELSGIFQYAFVQRAFLGGILIAAIASILGVFLVLRRFSLIGDGLSHVTFGSVAVVMLLGISPAYMTLAALPLVMLSSLAILKLTVQNGFRATRPSESFLPSVLLQALS
jgi:zinc transport system permease protein